MTTKSRNKRPGCEPSAPTIRIEFNDEQTQAIFIAGTFNEWSATATPMLAMGEGRWLKALSLPPGRYEYCLVVDGEWRPDPTAADQTPNVYGGLNSVLEVAPQHEQGQIT
jgi:1,4-alpha-glucan branching enzyme